MSSLIALGIEPQKARFALAEFGGDVEAAADWCWEEVSAFSLTWCLNLRANLVLIRERTGLPQTCSARSRPHELRRPTQTGAAAPARAPSRAEVAPRTTGDLHHIEQSSLV